MQPVTREDLPGLEEYLRQRDETRRRIIELRRRRRVPLGELVSLSFENRETVIYQICEMMRIEHITDPVRLQEEIDIYNDLIPAQGQLSATLFIEVPDQSQIREVLNRMVGVDEHLILAVDEVEVPGQSEPGRSTAEKTASVHYVKFDLPPEAQARWREGGAHVEIRCDHPRYRRLAVLTPEQVQALAEDFGPKA
jgi:hypothetical protein